MINAKYMIFRGCRIHGWILDRSTVCETWDMVELDRLRLKLFNFIQIYLSYTLVFELFLSENELGSAQNFIAQFYHLGWILSLC